MVLSATATVRMRSGSIPSPETFVAATFKCRSTPTGTLPTDADLYNAISRGFTNSNMPHWDALPPQNRIDLVAYIKTFSPRWKSEKPGDPIKIPAEPPYHRKA